MNKDEATKIKDRLISALYAEANSIEQELGELNFLQNTKDSDNHLFLSTQQMFKANAENSSYPTNVQE